VTDRGFPASPPLKTRVQLAYFEACEDDLPLPRSGPLLMCDVSLEDDVVVFSYRERGTGHGATLAFTGRSSRTLARMLEGTRVTKSRSPAPVELCGEVRQHVQGRKPAAP
jgi:hypothetical protein